MNKFRERTKGLNWKIWMKSKSCNLISNEMKWTLKTYSYYYIYGVHVFILFTLMNCSHPQWSIFFLLFFHLGHPHLHYLFHQQIVFWNLPINNFVYDWMLYLQFIFLQDVLEEYTERVKRRGAVLQIDPACLRWTPFVPPAPVTTS